MKAIFERVIVEDESTVRAFKYSKNSFETPWHIHPEYELTYVLKSSGIRYVGNNISDYQPGELVLLGPHLPHCWKNESESSEYAESLVIQWPKALIETLSQFRDVQQVLSDVSRGILFRHTSELEIQRRMLDIIESSSLTRYVKFIELLKVLSHINDKEILAGASYSYDLSNDTNDRIETVQSFVDKNYSNKIKLADIADELNMTEQSFSRFFSKTMQRPFFVYLNEYRVNRASRLLLETDMQVAEIGFKCGYESLPFFYQQFKKFKNYSPLGFRKMYRRASK